MNGWIKLHRSLESWEWYDDANTMRLFLHLLLRATHKPTRYRGQELQPGDVVTGRLALSEQLELSVQQVRTSLDKLKSTSEITIKNTNKFSIISIANWDKYQDDQPAKQPTSNHQTTIKQPSSNHIQEGKEDKNVKKSIELYNEMASRINIPVVQKVTPARQQKVKARLKEVGGIEGWVVCLGKVEHSELLSGKKGDWSATLDWIIKPENMTKIMEGNYDKQTRKRNYHSDFDEARSLSEGLG